MCATCGCGEPDAVRITTPHDEPHDHGHEHPHDHEHDHDDGHGHSRTLTLEQQVLAKNDELAAHNRAWLGERGIRAVNLMSSPGAGKTTLLTRTLRDLAADRDIALVEGDQETALDANRIIGSGGRVVQINTGSDCHLDAAMLRGALDILAPRPGSLIFVENVGNLVCPALFDLGEQARVVLTSVTEGANKPLKYPGMFATADLVVLNKQDLAPYVDFDARPGHRHTRRRRVSSSSALCCPARRHTPTVGVCWSRRHACAWSDTSRAAALRPSAYRPRCGAPHPESR